MMRLVRLRDVPRWFLNVLIVVLVLFVLACLFARMAVAAPKAKSLEQCQDMVGIAVAARAMTIEHIDQKQTLRVLARLYVPGNADGVKILSLVTQAAARSDLSVEDFGTKLGEMCVLRRGDMDEMLGTDS